MSGSKEVAEPDAPVVFWYVAPDGACAVCMASDGVLRAFQSPGVAAAQATIVSVAISEFAMTPEAADALAKGAVADQQKTADLPKTIAAQMKRLQTQFEMATNGANAEIKALKDELAAAKATVQGLETMNQQLSAQLAAATRPIPAPAPSPGT
jgi:hypothetical protein